MKFPTKSLILALFNVMLAMSLAISDIKGFEGMVVLGLIVITTGLSFILAEIEDYKKK